MDIVNMASDNIRILSAAMVEKAKSGHPGGAMGGADFINVLYSEFLNFDPTDTNWINRDRFFLDPGHMSPMLYSQLALCNFFSLEELKNFRQWNSPTPGHPELDFARGIENTSGPLGQGHVMAVGAAIAERFLAARFGEWMAHKTYTFISDGGIQEEISQGAGRIAGHLGLGNLVMFYDSNDIQLSTDTDVVTSEDTAAKYQAWGWEVMTIDGNDADAIRTALKKSQEITDKPVLIIGKTVMGKGALGPANESYERKCSTHGQPLSKAGADFGATVTNLGGNSEEPFAIFPEVKAHYADCLKQKAEAAAVKKAEQAEWAKANPELAAKLARFFSGKAPELDYSQIEQGANGATRVASKKALEFFADHVENMIISSADLSNSDNTNGFLNKVGAFKRGDFSGAFLEAGVAELTMAVICNGMAAHGGVIAGCATFFVFSDYMKPAIRLSALMGLPVKYIWTHDAFRVGEDGPTHQPIEQEAQIRLMEKLKNHQSQNSMLVVRPADAQETTVAWKMALENTNTPTGLIFSRQGITDLPAQADSRFEEALQAEKGAYIVKDCVGTPDIILVGNGSEVSTLYSGAEILEKEDNLKVRVISAISEGLFRSQPVEYQKALIPSDIPAYGLTAGLPVNLEGLVGPFGKIHGMDHFGYSAPFTVLDEKFGYTSDNVAKEVRAYLAENK